MLPFSLAATFFVRSLTFKCIDSVVLERLRIESFFFCWVSIEWCDIWLDFDAFVAMMCSAWTLNEDVPFANREPAVANRQRAQCERIISGQRIFKQYKLWIIWAKERGLPGRQHLSQFTYMSFGFFFKGYFISVAVFHTGKKWLEKRSRRDINITILNLSDHFSA